MLKNLLSSFRRESKEPVLYPSRRAIELYAAVSTGEEQVSAKALNSSSRPLSSFRVCDILF